MGLTIKSVVYKQCILTVIVMLSSMISLIGIGLFNDVVPVWVSSDMCLSAIRVVLMYEWNSRITDVIFCCFMPSQSVKSNVSNLEQSANAKAPTKTEADNTSITTQDV